MDQVGVWCERLHGGQVLCIRWALDFLGSSLYIATSMLSQEIDGEEFLRDDLFCVEFDIKP